MTSSPDLATELRQTLGRLVRQIRAQPGPSMGRMAILIRLDRDGAASVSDLAAGERMRPQSMAQAVGYLEEDGLVRRSPDPGDRRRMSVELTEAGRDLLRETRAQRDTWLAEVLDRELDAAERRQLQQALGLLGRIADA